MTTYDDIFPQSAEELQKEAQSIRDRHEEEQDQAERILHEFFTAAAEMQKICQAHDQCNSQCPLYNKYIKGCHLFISVIDSDSPPFEWIIEE